MNYWSEFYNRIFNFQQIRYFDIAGEYTGLHSKAMMAPDGKIRIPLNEEAEGSNGQIQEFLRRFNGEGIQHIAMQTDNILTTLDQLRQAGLPLMTAPSDTYYQMAEERLPGHGRDIAALQTRGILIDGNTRNGQKNCYCKFFGNPDRPAVLNSSNGMATTVLAKATSRRCLNPWSATSWRAVKSKPPEPHSAHQARPCGNEQGRFTD